MLHNFASCCCVQFQFIGNGHRPVWPSPEQVRLHRNVHAADEEEAAASLPTEESESRPYAQRELIEGEVPAKSKYNPDGHVVGSAWGWVEANTYQTEGSARRMVQVARTMAREGYGTQG